MTMSNPIGVNLRDISKLADSGDMKKRKGDSERDDSSVIDTAISTTINCVKGKGSKDLLFGTVAGWITGFTIFKVGKVAAFGLGGGIILLHFACELGYINVNWDRVRAAAAASQRGVDSLTHFVRNNNCYSVGFAGGFFLGVATRPSLPVTALTTPDPVPQQPPESTPSLPKPMESFKPEEPPPSYLDKPAFLPQKPISHSPKISPSSIPNPSPSVTTNKLNESGYPNYGGYLYSIPGYSAFQPISFPGMVQPTQSPVQNDASTEFVPFPPKSKETVAEDKNVEAKTSENQSKAEAPKKQMDFEEQFTPEIIPAATVTESGKTQNNTESQMSIASLAQGSGATVTISSQPAIKDSSKKKVSERYSLKTSIPISKIDMKAVNPQPDVLQSSTSKTPTTPFNPIFQPQKVVEIQSNVIIKNALKEPETKTEPKNTSNTNINTLINAAEAINKSEGQFRKPEPKQEVINEIKDPPPPPTPTARPLFNPINLDANKVNFANKPSTEQYGEQKNQIVFIQNKSNPSNSKMLLTIQQQNPQVLLQRTNFDPKNLQAPSRLSSQTKKCKDDVADNATLSKVVALKRLHQENCDENDFENLITENQIYGNKIVVKEKSQGTQQEQDLKNKKGEKSQAETKNVVLQPNFLYLSNVQFPANLMMIKNNHKVNQISETSKVSKIVSNENKATNEVSTMTNSNDLKSNVNSTKTPNVTGKEIHILKANNNANPSKNSKSELVFQTPSQKVIVNPQIVYQVPMIVDADNKLNQNYMNKDYPKFITQNKKEYPKNFEQSKTNDKLFIACPYQMDSKLQPKIVITNIRPKISKLDEVSSLDLYEKRRRMRRLKYLSNRDIKDIQKLDTKKPLERVDGIRNIITPDNVKAEIYKEFTNTKITIDEGSSDSESDLDEDDLEEYNNVIKEYSVSDEKENGKAEFLANFRLASHELYKEKDLDRQDRILRRDSVASAYIAAGRLDRLCNEDAPADIPCTQFPPARAKSSEEEDGATVQKKQMFFSQLNLFPVTTQFKEVYEKTWQEILKERKRRNGVAEPENTLKHPRLDAQLNIDPNSQLQILTEMQKSVTDNYNLIKKRLDSCDENLEDGDSIKTLAEKNFSELDRLSKMADRSVKLITGQDARKRDLNPGFDSENIQKQPANVPEQPFQNYPFINIPKLSKIISLKSEEAMSSQGTTTQATSMDEPQNSAAGVIEMFDKAVGASRTKEFGCQVEDTFSWPGLESLIRKYREYEAARKKEINDLHRRNTALRVDGAHVTRSAAHHSERARSLLAERQNLANEEATVRLSLNRLCRAIDVVRGYDG